MEKRMLSVAETAAWLSLSESYIYKLVEADSIPHVRFGRVIRFDTKEIEDWLKEGDEEETANADEHRGK